MQRRLRELQAATSSHNISFLNTLLPRTRLFHHHQHRYRTLRYLRKTPAAKQSSFETLKHPDSRLTTVDMPLVVPGITPASKKADHKNSEDDKKPKAQHFQAHPGPAIPEDKSVFEQAASKEEQHARAKELNKD